MTFRVDAPAFVPKNRSSASVVATNARDDVDAGATAGAGANANAVTGETTTAVAVTATSGDASSSSSSSSSSSEVERELREALEATTRELETTRARGERLKAAAAQAGRLSKAYSNVDEDVKRLTRELEEKTEQCEQAWELATMRESERDDARAAAARERDGLKEDLKAALRKALSTADELSRVKKSMVENEGTSSRAEARVEALESMLRAKEEELAGAKTAESLAAARAEKLEADAASSDDARARESAELEKSLMDLRVALDAANSKAESALGECERLKNELEAESSRGKLDELRGELDAAREKANEMTKKYEETKAAASDELRRARETESALSAALSDAEAQLVDSRKNVDLIVSRADKASEIFRENATALRLADARAATAELEASVAEERVKALEESLREVEEERDACKEERDACKKERDACKEELETLQKQPKQVSPTSPIASPAKTSAPIDVVEALEHERARARSTRATLAIGASATNPSLPAPVVRSHRFHRLHRRQALERPAPRWPSPRDYPKRRPRRRFERRFASSSPTSTNPPRTSPFLPSRRTHHHRPIAPTPSIEAWRTLHLTIARAFERSSPRTFDESRVLRVFSFPSDDPSCTITVRITIHACNHILFAHPRVSTPRLVRPRPPATASPSPSATY